MKKVKAVFFLSAVFLVTGAGLYFGRGFFYGAQTIHELLTENKDLKRAIANLTEQEQIGYARVVSQETRDGRVFTEVHFVETGRGNSSERVLEKDYVIEGDIVHFDALIVKFSGQLVAEGDEKSMYLWRRVYGEYQAPGDGFAIEQAGVEPVRYAGLLSRLKGVERRMFWESIWELANEPEKLKGYGIEGIYGNAVYTRLEPGLIYVFKINAGGQVWPEVVRPMD